MKCDSRFRTKALGKWLPESHFAQISTHTITQKVLSVFENFPLIAPKVAPRAATLTATPMNTSYAILPLRETKARASYR